MTNISPRRSPRLQSWEYVTKLEKGTIFISKEGFYPLYQKGDQFKVVRINRKSHLVPIEARRLKTGKIYGFYKEEIDIEKKPKI